MVNQDEPGIYNPFVYFPKGSILEIGYAINMAVFYVNPLARKELDQKARQLLTLFAAIILHLVYKKRAGYVTLAELEDFILCSHDDGSDLWLDMTHTDHDRFDQYDWRDADGQPTHTHPIVLDVCCTWLPKSYSEKCLLIKDLYNHIDCTEVLNSYALLDMLSVDDFIQWKSE
jgi:hypothetical protein